MLVENIPCPYKQNMQTMLRLTKSNLEDVFFNPSDSRLSWFTKEGIFDTIWFYPIQISFLSPTIKKKKVLFTYFFMMKFYSGFSQII